VTALQTSGYIKRSFS